MDALHQMFWKGVRENQGKKLWKKFCLKPLETNHLTVAEKFIPSYFLRARPNFDHDCFIYPISCMTVLLDFWWFILCILRWKIVSL